MTPESPVIVVTADSAQHAEVYARVIEHCGGTPRILLPGGERVEPGTGEPIGGLLVCGRQPADSPERQCGTQQRRGTVESPIIMAALDDDLPVLCIGRGMHTLNLAMGGGLVEDISGHAVVKQDGEAVSSYHRIFISPGSKLAAVVGSGGFVRVNSRHSRGVRHAQKSSMLMASAYSAEDGVIEALESTRHRWVIAVQFHPERRAELPPHFYRLFEVLVQRGRERTAASS